MVPTLLAGFAVDLNDAIARHRQTETHRLLAALLAHPGRGVNQLRCNNRAERCAREHRIVLRLSEHCGPEPP